MWFLGKDYIVFLKKNQLKIGRYIMTKLNVLFEKCEHLHYKCMTEMEQVKKKWEDKPFYVIKAMGDTYAIKDLQHTLENAALLASNLNLATEALIKHICTEA